MRWIFLPFSQQLVLWKFKFVLNEFKLVASGEVWKANALHIQGENWQAELLRSW